MSADDDAAAAARLAAYADALRSSYDPFVVLLRAERDSLLVALALDPEEELSSLQNDLLEYARRFQVDPVVELLISVPDGDACVPPDVRVLHPLLVPGSGRVINGTPVLPALMTEGWSPQFDIVAVTQWVRGLLLKNDARVALEHFCFANKQAFEATLAKLRARPDPALAHPRALQRGMMAYSSRFALEVMGMDIPSGFECGNKVLMSSTMLHALALGESAPRSLSTHRAAGSAAPSAFDDEALTFELVTHLPFPVYCGVAEFTCPHSDIVVVPQHMFADLCVPEGAAVAVRRVRLPAAAGLVLQPHSANFAAVRAFSGMDPRAFLERSLVRYATVQVGEVLLCDGGPPVVAAAAGRGGHGAAGAATADAADVSDDDAALALAVASSLADASPAAGAGVRGAGTDDDLYALIDDAFTASSGGGGSTAPSSSSAASLAAAAARSESPREECGGGESTQLLTFRFNVIAVRRAALTTEWGAEEGAEGPRVPAAALWTTFAGQLAIDFVPACDEYAVPRRALATQQAAPAGGRGGGAELPLLQPEMLAAAFGGTYPAATAAATTTTTVVAPSHTPQLGPLAAAASAQSTGGAAGDATAAATAGTAPVSAADRRRVAAEAARRRLAEQQAAAGT